MSWTDFLIIIGPIGIIFSTTFLGIMILYAARVWSKSSNNTATELKSTRTEITTGASTLKEFTAELRDDIKSLKEGNYELKEEMSLTRTSINELYKTWRQIVWWHK